MDETNARVLPRWFRTSLWLHRWAGLLATPFFLLLCLTGSILIFHEEVDRLLGDAPPVLAAPRHPLSIGRIAAAAAAQSPGEVIQSLGVSPDEPGQVFVGMVKPGQVRLDDARLILLDRGTGRLMPFSDPETTFTGTLFKLHARWFAGVPGEIFGGVIALLVLIALVTGVLVYTPYVRRLAFGEVRQGRGERLRQLDLHNLVGVVVLGWTAVVAMTGLALGLGSLALMNWQNTELKAMAGAQAVQRPATIVSVDKALAAARAAMPDRDPQLMFWPGSEFSSPRHYTFLMVGTKPWNDRLFDVALVDAGTGRIAAARPLPLYLQVVVISGPLHFGDYGGLPLKLLWLANAWGALFITGNGAWLWWAKRRRLPRVKPVLVSVAAE